MNRKLLNYWSDQRNFEDEMNITTTCWKKVVISIKEEINSNTILVQYIKQINSFSLEIPSTKVT